MGLLKRIFIIKMQLKLSIHSKPLPKLIVEVQKPEQLQQLITDKTTSKKKLSLTEGKAHAYQLIEAWAKGK